MGKCKTCRHWDSPNDAQGWCRRIEGSDGCAGEGVDLPPRELAQVQADYDHTGCALATAADFGCVLFEPHARKDDDG
jgi:hypothetical protein